MTKPVLPADLADTVSPATILVRGGATRSPHDETCEALFMTSGFVYDDAAAAEAAFANEGSRYVYSRYRNPTVAMFEERLRLIEGAEACRATASGMAAVFAALLCRLRAGQRVVSSRALFGSCHYIVSELLPRWGIETVLVDGRDLNAWETALAGGAAAAFCESPSNPAMELVDLAEVARLTHRAGGLLDRRQRLCLATVAKAVGARRRRRRLFRDQAHRRAGAQPRRGDLGVGKIRQGGSRPVLPAHRAVIEPVQRVAAVEGAGDARIAGRAAVPHRRRDRRFPRNPSKDRARHLSRAAEPSAIRIGATPDEGGRQRRLVRRGRRQGRLLSLFGRIAARRHLEQSRRLEEPRYPSGDDDALATQARGARRTRHRRPAWCGCRPVSKAKPT